MLHQNQRLRQSIDRHDFRARRFCHLAVVAGQRLRRFQPFDVGERLNARVIGAADRHRPGIAVLGGLIERGAPLRRGQRHLIGYQIKAFRLEASEHRIPRRFLEIDFETKFGGNRTRDFHVITGELAALVVIGERRVSAFRADGDGAVRVDALQQRVRRVGVGEGEGEGGEQQFFHGNSSKGNE